MSLFRDPSIYYIHKLHKVIILTPIHRVLPILIQLPVIIWSLKTDIRGYPRHHVFLDMESWITTISAPSSWTIFTTEPWAWRLPKLPPRSSRSDERNTNGTTHFIRSIFQVSFPSLDEERYPQSYPILTGLTLRAYADFAFDNLLVRGYETSDGYLAVHVPLFMPNAG